MNQHFYRERGPAFPWSDEHVEELKTRWMAGDSAAQIARALAPHGRVSRNAVIGKIRRLGLVQAGRAQASRPARLQRAPRVVVERRQPPRQSREPHPPRAPMPVSVEGPGSATIRTLGAHSCRWPIGDPAEADFTFCGRRADGDGPYCCHHHSLAHQPSAPRQPRQPSRADELIRALRRYA